MEGDENVKHRLAAELRSVSEQLTRSTVSEASVRHIGGIRDGTPGRGVVELAREAVSVRSPAPPPRASPQTKRSIYGDAELVEITHSSAKQQQQQHHQQQKPNVIR
ncbi:unnamed protein product [Anisakis simplex]|uniref:Uncharacterized protein n=1 Tax=Anisakis simplex TaxID=6269 RepID=A0A0M3J957_ANISI|nr:unnamed protein product [Anisakis simplex]VDK22666.1 unnamed protein product [Anisakis simplex]